MHKLSKTLIVTGLFVFVVQMFASKPKASDFPIQMKVVSTTVTPGSGITMIFSYQGQLYGVSEACTFHCWNLVPQHTYSAKFVVPNKRIHLFDTDEDPPKVLYFNVNQIYSSAATQ